MLISIQRLENDEQATNGKLLLDGNFECWTLEPRAVTFAPWGAVTPPVREKPYAVPAGTYRYRVCASAHFERNVICVDGIPGFDGIELHPGNYPKDTHGCCLIGRTQAKDFVGCSDAELDALLAKIPPVGEIEYLDIVNLETHQDAT